MRSRRCSRSRAARAFADPNSARWCAGASHGHRQRYRRSPAAYQADVRSFFHHEIERHGHGTVDMPFDHRGARWADPRVLAGTRRHHPRIPFTFARGAIAVTATPRKPGDGKDREEPVVLVIDDDESMREALKSLFRSVGLRAEVFGSAAELMRRALPDVPSCLVLDVRLPELSGLDFQAELLAAGIHMPVIFITGHGDIPMTVPSDEGRRGRLSHQAVPSAGDDPRRSRAPRPRTKSGAAMRRWPRSCRGLYESLTPPRAGDHGVRERGGCAISASPRISASARSRSKSTACTSCGKCRRVHLPIW